MSEFQVFSSYYQSGSRAALQIVARSSSVRSEYVPIDPDDWFIRLCGWFITRWIERPLIKAYWWYMGLLGLD